MARPIVRIALALCLPLTACSDGITTPQPEPVHSVLVTFLSPPSESQLRFLREYSIGELMIIRPANAVRVLARPEFLDLHFPGTVGVRDLGSEADPIVSISIALDREPTDEQLAFVTGLGAATVYPLAGFSTIAAVRLRLSRVAELELLPGVQSVEIYVAGDGPRIG